MRKVHSLVGQRFGRGTVLEQAESYRYPNSKRTLSKWKLMCDCKNIYIAYGCSLRSGETVSCGCYQKERAAEAAKKKVIHGMSNSSEYQIFQDAKARCINPKHHAYKYYGKRGIKFLLPSFIEFYKSIGPRPSSKHSLDRINNDGDYTLNNIRWATKEEQIKNRRNINNIACANCGCREFVKVEEVA